MDAILSRVTQHAMNYAIRSGVTIATGYTIKQCGRLLQQAPGGREREQIAELQIRLETKIRIVSPAIDMIELMSARGNTSLESAVTLTRGIRLGIQELGVRLNKAVENEQHLRQDVHSREMVTHELLRIIADMRILLQKIDDAVPLINLAITTSGATFSSKLSSTVSPSRLLQASAFLTSADATYTSTPAQLVQVGPTFIVSLYMLFAGHCLRPVNETGVRDTTWKEVMHKAHVKLIRLPLEQLSTPSKRHSKVNPSNAKSFRASLAAAEYAYQLSIVEDLDDDRVHTSDDYELQPESFDGIKLAGIREILPVHEIAKIFYADTGKILNIQGDSDEQRPVLLLKRDERAEPPCRMAINGEVSGNEQSKQPDRLDLKMSRTPPDSTHEQSSKRSWSLPSGLDPEWIALEVFGADPASFDDSSDISDDDQPPSAPPDEDSSLLSALSRLALPLTSSPLSEKNSPTLKGSEIQHCIQVSEESSDKPAIKTTLSLLEMLIKLAALQQFRQESHLAIEDELLNLFLQETATAGNGEGKARRQRIRHNAVQRVGFDPYDESPIKMRSMARGNLNQARLNAIDLGGKRSTPE